MDSNSLRNTNASIVTIWIGINAPTERMFFRTCFQALGYDIIEYIYMTEILDALLLSLPDLIIFDYNFDGYPDMEAGSYLYSQNEDLECPLLFLVPRRTQVVYPDMLKEKYVSWTHKPFQCAWYQEYVQRLFQRQQQAKNMKEEARVLFTQNSTQCEGFVLLGRACMLLGNRPGAKDAYINAIDKTPNCAEAHFLLGELYFDEKMYEAAIKSYMNAIQAHSMYAEAYYRLGIAFRVTQRADEAILAWKAALECGNEDIASDVLFQLQLTDSTNNPEKRCPNSE